MKKLVALLLTLCLALSFVGCAGQTSAPAVEGAAEGADGEVKIAVILKSLTNSFWMLAKHAAEAKGAELGVTVTVFAIDEETDYQSQVNTIEDCITNGYDVIAIVPADSNALVPACKEAVDKGIPVLVIDTALSEDGIATAFIGSDNTEGGKMAADYVIEKIGTEGNVAVIRGLEGNTVEIERYTGFSEQIAAASKLKIVAEDYADWASDQAANTMEDFLTAHPEIQAVFCESDMMVIGASQAAHQAGRDDIVFIGLDGTVDALRYVKDGTINADVAQRPDLMGEYAVEYGLKLAKGEKVDSVLVTPMSLATADTVDELISIWEGAGF